MTNSNDIIVFDIGGTWFRSGIFTKNEKLISVSKIAAYNYRNSAPDTTQELQKKLITYIIKKINLFEKKYPNKKFSHVAISMGAALNSYTGMILNSGPLWGPTSKPLDLRTHILKSFPHMKVIIVNDVSAALLREIDSSKEILPHKIMLITISTGIACRIYDSSSKTIPVDKVYGIQGEIGHIPINFSYGHENISLTCDCGGINHLNAYCSGRGIEALSTTLSKKIKNFSEFISALNSQDKVALDILQSVTKPIAELLIVIFTIDPNIEQVIFTGGVTHSLGNIYINSILNWLNRIGMYQITENDKQYFNKRIKIGFNDDNSCLIGAALSIKYNI